VFLGNKGVVFPLNKQNLWIVGGGEEAVPGIERAKQMGLRVIVSDGNSKAPGFDLADAHFVVSTYDYLAHIRLADKLKHKPDGVICMGCDVPVTVARLAEHLGCTTIGMFVATLSADKYWQKCELRRQGIQVPRFWNLYKTTLGEVEGQLPLVIKPIDSRGARGVRLVRNAADIRHAYEEARQYGSGVLAEEFLEGPQISTESVITATGAATPGFSDRNYDFEATYPYMVENGGTMPSQLSLEQQAQVCWTAEAAARALGFVNCTAKGDLVLTKDGPKVIEMAARLSGGYFATDQIPLSTGVDLVGIAIRLALGEAVDIQDAIPKKHMPVAIRYQIPDGVKDHTQRGLHHIALATSRESAVWQAEYMCRIMGE